MLVLSRKKDESVVINHDVTVTIIEIRGDKVRLGIEAPDHVAVDRQEVDIAKSRDKLLKLIEIYEMDKSDFLAECKQGTMCPGICLNKECEFNELVELTECYGYCENCRTNTVKSALLL